MKHQVSALRLWVVAAAVVGASYLGLGVAWMALFDAELPSYSLGKWVALAFTVGGLSLLSEAWLLPLLMDGDRQTDALWKRALRLLAALGLVLLMGVAVNLVAGL